MNTSIDSGCRHVEKRRRVEESLSDPILATDDLEEPQPPPEAPAHLPGADNHQDVEQKQDLPAQKQEKEPIENPTTPPNTAAL